MDTIHINSLPPLHQRMIVDWRLWTGAFLKKSHLCIESQFSQAQGTFLPDPKCTVFLCAPSRAVLNQVMPLFLNFGPFGHTRPIYSYFVFLSAVSPAISRCVFLFDILRVFSKFSRFFEILQDFTYSSFLLLSSRVKNHICILWNPSICFNNNNNNNKNNNKYLFQTSCGDIYLFLFFNINFTSEVF